VGQLCSRARLSLDVASFVDHHSLAWKSSAKPAAAKLQQSTSSQFTFPPHCHLNPGPCQLCIYTHGQDASHTGLAPAGHKTLESQSSRSEKRRVSASLCKRAFNSRLKEPTAATTSYSFRATHADHLLLQVPGPMGPIRYAVSLPQRVDSGSIAPFPSPP
jgi:hypothetical protein